MLLNDLRHAGLAGAVVVLTMAAYSAAIAGLLVYAILSMQLGMPRQTGRIGMGIFWVICMIQTWRYLRRAKSVWPESAVSTSLFHGLQITSIVFGGTFAAACGGFQSKTFFWFGFIIEFTIALFFVCYVFLGLTLPHKMARSTLLSFAISVVAVFWSARFLPPL